jgi:thiosulfate/3-mercaptopyruvate sulfurtransferase
MPVHTTIVDPEELRAHLGDPAWVVIDCRYSLQDFTAGRRAYEAGHIPGAFLADLERDLAGEKTGTNGRHPLPDPETFGRFLRSCGVGDRSQVVAYDEGADMYAARLWFLCRWIGHDAVAVLDGGISAWRGLAYPIETEEHRGVTLSVASNASEVEGQAPGMLAVRLRPKLVATADDILANLRSPAMHVIDARAADRFRGEIEPLDPVAGHIPGAHNYWFKENFDERGRLKSPQELRRSYARYGAASEIVHQCGSGVSSAVNMLAMERAGLRGSRLYAGSWSEWCSDPSRPVATGD